MNNLDSKENINPFSLTKSADMTDMLIHKLWVDVDKFDLASKIKSLNPVFLIGGKGSGKTHLLRHYSYPLQKIRFEKNRLGKIEGVKQDGYIGIYYRCKGLQADRFSGKGYSEEIWHELFGYAFELTLGHELIFILNDLIEDKNLNKTIATKIGKLLDISADTLETLEIEVSNKRQKLYQAISNSALGFDLKKNPDAKILTSRGDLIFEIPKIIRKHINDLEIPCIYLIDEIENFGASHQKYLNTLIREKEPEISIKIGARKYGVKTDITLSDGEALIEGSEKETFLLDDFYRLDENKDAYKKFLFKLLRNRVDQIGFTNFHTNEEEWVNKIFEEYEPTWNDQRIRNIVFNSKKEERFYFWKLRKKLENIKIKEINDIIKLLSAPEFPILEKVNVFNFYKNATEDNYLDVAKEIGQDCSQFIHSDGKDTKLQASKTLSGHYKNNIIFQIRAEYSDKAFYNGVDSIINMSEGMPRNFLQVLKRMYDWGFQLEENPFLHKTDKFSLEAQRKSIHESAEWFFDDVRECEDRDRLKECIARLGQLLRINHFADLPKECSCISIAVEVENLSKESQKMIKVAENYSFLIGIEDHKDKNHSSNLIKRYQLNKMLCPIWDLPLARRGTKQLSPEESEAIFNPSEKEKYTTIRNRWEFETTFSLKRNKKQGSLL